MIDKKQFSQYWNQAHYSYTYDEYEKLLEVATSNNTQSASTALYTLFIEERGLDDILCQGHEPNLFTTAFLHSLVTQALAELETELKIAPNILVDITVGCFEVCFDGTLKQDSKRYKYNGEITICLAGEQFSPYIEFPSVRVTPKGTIIMNYYNCHMVVNDDNKRQVLYKNLYAIRQAMFVFHQALNRL